MCDKPLGGEDITTDPCQAAAFMFMAASLMNELIHVYQVAGSEIPGNDAHNALVNKKRCDAEKDSDCASIIVINKFIDNLTKPDPNDPAKKIPHTSLNDISGDPSYISFMTRVLTESNIDTPAEIAEIVEKLLEQLAEYENRKNNLFAAAITLDINWGPIYRNGWDGEPLKKINKDASGTFVFPIDPLLPPTHFQTIPAGNLFPVAHVPEPATTNTCSSRRPPTRSGRRSCSFSRTRTATDSLSSPRSSPPSRAPPPAAIRIPGRQLRDLSRRPARAPPARIRTGHPFPRPDRRHHRAPAP